MVPEAEAVRLVAEPLQELESRMSAREEDRSRELTLRERCEWDPNRRALIPDRLATVEAMR